MSAPNPGGAFPQPAMRVSKEAIATTSEGRMTIRLRGLWKSARTLSNRPGKY